MSITVKNCCVITALLTVLALAVEKRYAWACLASNNGSTDQIRPSTVASVRALITRTQVRITAVPFACSSALEDRDPGGTGRTSVGYEEVYPSRAAQHGNEQTLEVGRSQ